MKKCLKRFLSAFLSAAMLAGSVTLAPVTAMAATATIAGGGWYETIFAELTGVTASDVTAVSYSGEANGSLDAEALKYLVRDVNGKVRIDIPGVKEGSYTLTVNTKNSGTLTKQNIQVYSYDRSGYAHWKYNEGVGAYKDDGTLKPNAKILYVTNDNKNTVSVTSNNGITVTGIGNILNSVGAVAKTTGAKTNSNQGIIKQLALENTPLVVRIIGDVKAPDGLTAYDSDDYGGTVGDNGFMARIQSGKNITIEGIGTDATMDGWGIHYICQSSSPDLGKSFEVRNLAFRNVPEDCVGMEGQQEGSTITAGVERCWIHHCEFYKPTIANPAESDKAGGDGACDFKRGQYFTNSYCYYEGYHKTNLVGSSDSSLQFNLTYHHNHWKGCEARGPLGRQANIHMYNNYIEGQTDYAMQTRANCYIFSEYNLFYQCKNPQQIKGGGPIKSYMDSLSGCIEAMQATVVKDKSQVVTSSNKYSAFDTNPDLSYIPSGDYKLDESIPLVKATVLSQAGVMKAEPVMDPEDVNTSMVAGDRQPTASVKLPYDHDLNSSYVTSKSTTVDNVIFNVAKTDGSCITVGGNEVGQDIVFNVNTAVNISITDGGGTYPVILMNDSGQAIITGTGIEYNLPAGTYFIQSSGFQPAKGSTPAKYKEAKITHLKITAFDPEAPTEAEPTTQATTQAKETQASTSAQEPDTQATTEAQGGSDVGGGTDADNTLHSFTDDGLTDPEEFFAFENASTSTSKGTMTYNGKTLTKCLKMESATEVVFTSEKGKVILVMNNTSGNSIKLDGTEKNINDYLNGASEGKFELPVEAGTHTITKGSGSTNMFYIEFVSDTPKTPVVDPDTPDTQSAAVSVVSQTVAKGAAVKLPIKITGAKAIANYAVTLSYTPGALTYSSVQDGTAFTADDIEANATSGQIKIAGVNSATAADDGYLCYVNFIANSSTDITLTVDDLKSDETTDIKSTVANGSITVNTSAKSLNGDANRDNKVDTLDAITVLNHISNIKAITDSVALANADCDGKAGIDMEDVIWILNYKAGDTPEPSVPTGAFDWTAPAYAAGKSIKKDETIYSTSRVNIIASQDLLYGQDASPVSFGDTSVTDYVKTNGVQTTFEGTAYRVAVEIQALDDVTVSIATWFNADKNNKTLAFINKSTSGIIKSEKPAESRYDFFTIELKKGDVVYFGGSGTNPQIYGIIVNPKDGEVQESSTEATTKAAVTTTKEATTEATTKDQSGLTALDAGTYQYSNILSDTSHFKVSGNKSSSSEVKINDSTDSYVELKLNNGAEVTITYKCGSGDNGKTAWVIFNGKTGESVDHAGGQKTLTVSGVPAGVYKITAGQSGGTSASILSVKVTYGSSVVEPPTQATTAEKPTQATTVNIDGAINVAAGDVASLRNALTSVEPGGVVNLAPGTYKTSDIVKISSTNKGTSSAPKTLTCTGGQAVFDFSGQSLGGNNRGIQLDGSYWNVSNLRVKGAGDNGMIVTGHYINVENCVFEGNRDSGLQVSYRGSSAGSDWPSDILIKNCTSYNNMDPDTKENADGFAAKLTCGNNVVFDGCISYNNSDDGWDLFAKSDTGPIGAVTIKNCVAFNNGKLTDGSGSANGDMNGFKLGGSGIGTGHIVENCIAFNNGAYGFTDNNNPDLASVTNCTAYANNKYSTKSNYGLDRATKGLKITNCISYGLKSSDKMKNAVVKNSVFYNSKYYLCNGTLSSPSGTQITPSDSDFESMTLPYTDLSKVHEQMRNADGSINMKGFLQPKSSGQLNGMGAKF